MQPELNFNSVKYFRDRERISEADAETYKKFKYNPFVTVLPTILQLLLLMAVIEVIKAGINKDSLDMTFMGFNLSIVPLKAGNLYYLFPFLAAVSSFLMCVCQNASNVIQAEQSKAMI